MKRVRRAIVIFPALPDTSPVHALRQRFDLLAGLVPPHITLVFPFESDLTAEQLRGHVQETVRGIGPFPVRLAQVTGFEGEYLFLNVKQGNDQLIALHDRLYSGPLAAFLSVEHTFVPHMTVGRVVDEQTLREALDFAATLDISLDVIVSEVSVYTIEPAHGRAVEFMVPLFVMP